MVNKPVKIARLINLGKIDSNFRLALYDFFRAQNYNNPLILIFKPTKDTLFLSRGSKFSEFINLDKIPENCDCIKFSTSSKMGVVFSDTDTISCRIYYPINETGLIWNKFSDSVIGVLRDEYGINVFKDPRRFATNDLVFKKDGRIKKFCGVANPKNENLFMCVFTLSFNANKIKGLYKLNHPKFTKKGEVNNIEEVVGGLKELNPEIKDDVFEKIILRLCKKLNWSVENSSLTEEETKTINKLINNLSLTTID